jgi:hypothetical protein
MSTPQRIPVRTMVVVNRETADVLRLEAKKILVFGHELFEDYLEYGPEAQCILATRFHDTCELITALGWDPDAVDPNATKFEVFLTDDLIDQLGKRRMDLALTNADRLPENNGPISPELLAEITINRLACGALTRLFNRYARATEQ